MKKLTLFLVAVGIIALFTSCDDELATSPYDSIDADAAYQTVSDLDAGALGAYATISGQNIYAINALMTDQLRRADSNTGQGMQIFNHNIIAGDGTIEGAWANAYIVIDRINRVLEAIETIEPQNADETSLVERITGEMLALRAYQHFDLYRIYVDYDADGSGLAVPYMTESVIGSPARDTKADFFSALEADLSQANNLLSSFGFYSNLRMNLHAVEGLQARVALYREDWSSAIDHASNVIDAVSLTSRTDYPNLWDDSLQGEVIFKLRRTDGTINLTERSGNDDIFFFASNELSSLYDETDDIRFSTFFQRNAPDEVQVFKYNKRTDQKNVADIKMMRVSEMYLLRAEAYAQPGPTQDLGAAESDMDALRAERLASPIPVTYSSSQDAIDDIYVERRLELAYEGHRFFDLRRANLPITRLEEDIDGATNTETEFLAADDYKMVYPIPQSEMFANDNMVQNEGY
ncbi:RagB/SusD family nutrient uptake outer membrane protein [Rhodohalobacter sp. 8-1]|uniref:RagB/SusD family nutrient uptake outer membrane protein n=1 Tax=Rhodohalobacter sp. 8-1 TaxID=3131972 RepID=UPI0030EDB6CE